MDRPLDDATVRRNRLARIARVVLPVLGLVAVLVWLPGWVRPSVTRARIRTAPITTGPIEAVITASGTQMQLIVALWNSGRRMIGVTTDFLGDLRRHHVAIHSLETRMLGSRWRS